VVLHGWRPPTALGPLVLLVLVLGVGGLEHLAGRFPFRPWLGAIGLVLVGCGLALHAAARRTLGAHWSRLVEVRERHVVVQHGPYAHVRHPLYLGVMLMATGSFLAHPSLARGAIAWGLVVGLLLKMRLEERALREVLGDEYIRYAERVPALLPRLGGAERRSQMVDDAGPR